jgi:integrase
MAAIRKRENKDGTASWLVQIRIKGSPPINRSFPTYPEAEGFVRSEESRLRREQNQKIKGDPRQFHNEIFTDTIRAWIEKNPDNTKRVMQLQTVLRNFGNVRIGMIDEDYVQEYVDRMLKTRNRNGNIFAPGSLSQHFAAMSVIYKWRAKQLRVPVGDIPFKSTLLPKGWNEGRDRRLEPSEETSLRARMRLARDNKHHWRLLLNLALESGARFQELFLAEWKHISIERRNWHIPKEHCKTRKARDVPMSKKMIRTFKMLEMLRSADDPRVFHPFKSKDGLSSTFFYFLEGCKIVDFHFHDLRHEAISRMVLYKRDLNMFEIMRIVGHSSIKMLDRYANLRSHELADRMG